LAAFAALLALPIVGLGIWRLDAVRRMDLDARLAVAFAAGTMISGAVMTAMSIAGIEWTRGRLMVSLGLIGAASVLAGRPSAPLHGKSRVERWPAVGMAVFILLTIYGLLGARESCGDLHFFWGPKAIRFYYDGGITLGFLADPNTVRMNPGYPILLPLLYAWAHTVARHFSWFAAVAATALFMFGSVALVRGTTRDDRGALLMAGTLAWCCAVAFAAGAADVPLLFFETLAMVALTFIDQPRRQVVLAALGLAGAVMLKIEGATFAIALVVAHVVVRRNVRQTLVIAAPAALLITTWLAWVKAHGLFELYRGAGMPVYLEALPKTLAMVAKAASYDLFGLPWFVPLMLIALGGVRLAALPLLVAVLTFAAAIFFYVHLPDPTWWILSSAPRVLLTPLTALLIGAVAAWHPRTIG
jgi:hypothetical protein